MLDAEEYFSARTSDEDPVTVPGVDSDFGPLPSHDLISVGTPDDENRALKRARLSSSLSVIWTKDADDQLRYIMEQIAPNWQKICEQIQSVHPDLSLTPEECEKRWSFLSKLSKHGSITPMPTSTSKESKKSKEFPTWTEEEKQLLVSLVQQAQKGDGFNANRNMQQGSSADSGPGNAANVKVISWLNIARQLNRTTEDVNHQWNQIRLSQFRKGAFTEEEDALIIQRVREWNAMPTVNNKPRLGIWVALEKELNREDKRISERWRSILSKRIAASEQLVGEASPLGSVKGDKEMNNAAMQAAAIIVKDDSTIAAEHQQAALLDAAKYAAAVVCAGANGHDDGSDSSTGSDHPMTITGKSTPGTSSNGITTQSVATLNAISPSVSKSVRWNNTMDNYLRESMTYFGSDWKKIAEYVNQHQTTHGGSYVDDNKCRGRYYRAIRTDAADDNIGNPLIKADPLLNTFSSPN